MKTLVSVRRVAQGALAAGLVLLVGCNFPLAGGGPLAGRIRLPDVVSRTSQPSNEGMIVEVEKPVPLPTNAQGLPAVEVGDAGQIGPAEIPPELVGKPYGGITVAIRWPQLKTSPYQAQVIPASARSIRIRVIGSDGTDRLAVMFFRDESASNTLTQKQTFFLPVEPGLLVEGRAYEVTRSQLTEKPEGKRAKFNPPDFKDFDMVPHRVLAEGFAFNQQIILLKETKIKIELDTSQLVAGIGGSPGISTGGDPYFNNFISRARFAELWDPKFVWYDPYGKRLFWNESPTFKSVPDPKDRDIVRMLTPVGVNATESEGVLIWAVGGDRIIDRTGDNNPPSCSEIRNVKGMAWSSRGPTLYIAQAGSQGFGSSVRKLSPSDGSGTMGTITQFKADNINQRNFVSVAAAFDGSDDVFSIDTSFKRAMINRDGEPFPVLAGSPSAGVAVTSTQSVSPEDAQFNDPRAISGKSMFDFAIADGKRVIRIEGGLARVRAGGGGNSANTTLGADNVAHTIAFETLKDLKYDPVATAFGGPIAYVAATNVLWRVQLGAVLTDIATATPIALYSTTVWPESIAVDPDGSAVYVLKSNGRIEKVTGATGTSPATADLAVAAFSNATAIAAGTGPGGKDQLFVANLAPFTSAQVVSTFLEDSTTVTATLFGVVDRNELSVGDCTTFPALTDGGFPREFAKFGDDTGSQDPTGAGNLTRPTWLATDKLGYLYISDTNNNRIRRVKFNTNNAPIELVSLVTHKNLDAKTPRLDSPQGVDADEYGNAFICDTNNHQVIVWRPCDRLFAYDSGLLPIAGTSKNGINFDNINARLVQLNGPKAVRVEQAANGNPSRRRVFFIDQGKRIRMLTPHDPGKKAPDAATQTAGSVCPANDTYFDYIISTIAGAGKESADLNVNAANVALDAPTDLAVDSGGYVYVADGAKVRRIDPVIGSIATVYTAPNPLTSISIDAARKELYFTMQNSVSVRKVFLGD